MMWRMCNKMCENVECKFERYPEPLLSPKRWADAGVGTEMLRGGREPFNRNLKRHSTCPFHVFNRYRHHIQDLQDVELSRNNVFQK